VVIEPGSSLSGTVGALVSTRQQHRPTRRRLLAVVIALALGALVADYYLYPRWATVRGPDFNTGANGLWLRYWWYFGERSDRDREQLAQQLTRNEIRYAYFHVRYVTASGTLRYHYPQPARRLVQALHAAAPGVEVLAWVYAGNARAAGGPIQLADARVRENMVREARWLVEECGFDGVQWDYEVCRDGEEPFLDLLRQTRAALPRGKLLSVAAPMWMPLPLSARGEGWTEAYFAQVAAACDQVAVMCYDSGIPLPRAYVWLVRQQAIHVTRAVAASQAPCRVLLGLPTYEAGPRSHYPHAENLRLALQGVREGLADPRSDGSVFAGVALFADYTTDAQEWAEYVRLWLGFTQPH